MSFLAVNVFGLLMQIFKIFGWHRGKFIALSQDLNQFRIECCRHLRHQS
jgi:hypothetical protein